MSVCVQPEEESASASEEAGAPLREAYEQKSASKLVRVLTVLAYLLSVSLAAILLSVYYVCVWKSPELPPLNGTGAVAERRVGSHTSPSAAEAAFHHVDGRGSIAVDEAATSTLPATIASGTTDSSSAGPEHPLLATRSLSADNRTSLQPDPNGRSNNTSVT